ncbi:hypothetical protein CesoFtcFv8_027522 [Champsocephalus esox]|uniref:Uncharacterized protein n=1 Tax=Champsocephalus esox TaxID=159716 RepID=A0AAN7YCE1_9TELE|nr:hypothetical protein CesoFtcFv8_027522 [Champsocephalus esox]
MVAGLSQIGRHGNRWMAAEEATGSNQGETSSASPGRRFRASVALEEVNQERELHLSRSSAHFHLCLPRASPGGMAVFVFVSARC